MARGWVVAIALVTMAGLLPARPADGQQCDYQQSVCSGGTCSTCCYSCEQGYDSDTGRYYQICSTLVSCVDTPVAASPNSESPDSVYSDDDTFTPPADFADPPSMPTIPTDPNTVCSQDPNCTLTQIRRTGGSVLDCKKAPDLPACASVGLDEATDYQPPPPGPPRPPSPNAPQIGGDPVSLATGELRLSPTDLSYAGPVRPFQFSRSYASRSDRRGLLGSNWTHRFAAYLRPVTRQTPGAPAVCLASDQPCVYFHDDDGSQTLFIRPVGQDFFLAPTRNDATLHETTAGWTLREPDGRLFTFNADGYLIGDRDRFGNGFTIHQEETPLYRLYKRWCLGDGPTTHPNDDPRVCAALAYAFEDGPPASWPTWKVPDGASVPLVTEKCQYQLRPDPNIGINCRDVPGETLIGEFGAFSINPAIYVVHCGNGPKRFRQYTDAASHLANLALDAGSGAADGCTFIYTVCDEWPLDYRDPIDRFGQVTSRCTGVPWTRFSGKLAWPKPTREHVIDVPDGILYEEVALPEEPSSFVDREAILAFLGAGSVNLDAYGRSHGMFFTPPSTYGARRYRPTSVQDDLGRSLSFDYVEPLDISGISTMTPSHLGLLKSVHGPDGRTVSFQYARPAGYPQRLNELFLTRVGVFGGGLSTAGVRYATTPEGDTVDHGSTHYVYDWPNEGGGSYVDFLYDLWRSRVGTRDGRRVASLDAMRYIASMADNITTIVRNRPDAEVIELESRYYRYPTDASVDRVSAQRFGSGPPSPHDGWATTAPRMDFRYLDANPRLAIAEVPTDLVSELRQKYPREAVPQEVRDAAAAGHPLGYFQPDEDVDDDVTLRRTPLPCGSIARFDTQLAFASSAGLTADDLRRARETIRLDANRICAWTVVTERDGTRRYLGFSARGDTLVEAVYERDDERYFFTERLYDEDGRTLAFRSPTSRLTPGWRTHHGATLFSYRGYGALDAASWRSRGNLLRQVSVPVGGVVENSNGDQTDQDVELAVGRLTRFAYEPAFNQVGRIQWGVVLADGHDRVEYEMLHAFEGRCTIVIPPVRDVDCEGHRLICLVHTGVAGKLLEALDDLDLCWSRSDSCLDSERRATESLDEVARSPVSPGAGRDPAGSKQVDEWVDRLRTAIKEASASRRQTERRTSVRSLARIRSEIESAIDRLGLDLPDLRGRLDPGLVQNPCSVKRPSTVILRRPAHPDTARVIDLEWNTAGLPTRLHERQGTTTRFQYYSPTNSIGSGNRGLLARVTLTRFDEDYGAIFDRPPCADGAGPYRFILSPDCGLRQAIDWPAELTAALERAGNGSDSTQVTYEYSVLGLPSARVEDGRRWTFVRDPAGRLVESTTPDGVTTTVRRTFDGLPARVDVRHLPPGASSPVLLGRVRQTFSRNGSPLRICRELTADGCAGFEQFDVSANDLLSVDGAYQLTVREYDAEDRLSRLVSPVGLVTERDYNARGLPIRVRHHRLGSSANQVSHTGYCYSERGEVVRMIRGANARDEVCDAARPPIVTSEPSAGAGTPGFATPAPPQLTCPEPGAESDHTVEIRSYDGLGRLAGRTDARKVRHRYRWTPRDLLESEEIGQAVCGPVETRQRTYDDHGQPATLVRNGAYTTSFTRGPWGRSVKVSSTGLAPAYAIFDRDGTALWIRDQGGDEEIAIDDVAAQVGATLTLRRTAASGSITQTRVLSRFDPAGRPVSQTMTGRDAAGQIAQQERSWEWTPLGHLSVERRFDGRVLSYKDGNLLGWPRRICEKDACAQVHYNRRADVILAYDPAGQLSTFRWNVFGQPTFARYAGNANASSWSYDTLGRVTGRVDPSQVAFVYRYDGRGDLVRAESQGDTVQELKWDEQGRIARATDLNRRGAATFPVSTSFIYDAWGRVQEETTELPFGLAPRTVTRSWTPFENEATEAITLADGLFRALRYDGAGRLASVQYAGDALATPTAELRVGWQGGRYAGRDYRRIPEDAEPLVAATRSFDPLGRPLGLRTTGPLDAAVTDIVATYDPTGRIGSLATLVNGASAGRWRGYAYDGTGRLSDLLEAESVTPPSASGSLATDVLSLGNTLGAVHWKYARDPLIGSTNEISASAAVRWNATLPRAPGYQLQQVAVNGTPPLGVAYDVQGRIAKLDTRTFDYDLLGRLAVVRSAAGAVIEQYVYGAGGELRVVVGPDGAPIHAFVHDRNRPAVAFDAAGKPAWDATWLPGGTHLLLWRDLVPPGRTIFPVSDLRHDVVGAWDVDTKSLAGQAWFDPEGRVTSESSAGSCTETAVGDVCPGAGGMPLGFAGAWRSPVTGLVLLGKRWYSPVLGEFLSPDPLGVADSWNRYAYARFDPINRWDPDGRESKLADDDTWEATRHDGFDFLDVTHRDGTTTRYQIVFYMDDTGRQQHWFDPMPGQPGDPCYENPAFCTCRDKIEYCTGRVDPDLFPWEMVSLARLPFDLVELGVAVGPRLWSWGSRGIGLLRGLGGGKRGLNLLEDVAETTTKSGPAPVAIPKLVTADKEVGQLLGESMQQVKTVEGFGRRSQMIRGLYTQIAKATKGWFFKEAPGLDGSRIFYGTANATIVRPDGAVFRATVSISTEAEIKAGTFLPPYEDLIQMVPAGAP